MQYELDLISAFKETNPDYLLICTYTLSLSYLEKKLLNYFSRELDTKIHIISSNTGYSESINEIYSLNGIGTDYILTRINDFPNVFHSKVFLAINKEELHLFVGGSNFTYPGLCLNWDTIEKIDNIALNQKSKNNLDTFLINLTEWVTNSKANEYLSHLQKELNRIQINNSRTTFIHNFQESIGNQILQVIPSPIKKIKIISPFLDENVNALNRLLKKTEVTDCSLLINNEDSAINLNEIPSNVNIFIPKSQFKSKDNSKDKETRYLHSKLYAFYTENKVYTLIGSANCTDAGLWGKVGNGNFETGIIREYSEPEYIDELFNLFQPKKVQKYWDFIPPEKDDKKDTSSTLLLFEAELQFDSIIIRPMKNFPDILTGDYALLTNSGEVCKETFIDLNKEEGNIYKINFKEANRIAGTSCKIVLEIKSDTTLRGEAWLIQNHILSRNKTVRNLMNAIKTFQRNEIEGWHELSTIINFVSANMHTVSIRDNHSTKSINQKTYRKENKGVPIISEIYNSSDYFRQTNNYSTYLTNCIDIGRALESLIENGLNLDTDTDIDEDIEVENTNNKEKRKNNQNDLLQEQKIIDDIKKAKEKIIIELPDLKEVFHKSIIEPIEKFLKQEKFEQDYFYSFFNSFINMVFFCLKLSRFILVEIPLTLNSKKIKEAELPTIRENKDVLLTFEKVIKIAMSKNLIEKEEIKETLINSEVIVEVFIFLIELWATNIEQKIGHKYFFGIFHYLLKLFNKNEIINLVETAISNTNRYDEKRNNLFIKRKDIRNCLENIFQYQSNKNQYELFYQEYLKYTYWKDAISAENLAYTTMINSNSKNLELINEHKWKEKVAIFRKNQLEKKESLLFGDTFNSKLRDLKNCVGIDEIPVVDGNMICPSCNALHPISILFTIKEFICVECNSCKRLFIPVPKDFKTYNVCSNIPAEWILTDEEKEVFDE